MASPRPYSNNHSALELHFWVIIQAVTTCLSRPDPPFSHPWDKLSLFPRSQSNSCLRDLGLMRGDQKCGSPPLPQLLLLQRLLEGRTHCKPSTASVPHSCSQIQLWQYQEYSRNIPRKSCRVGHLWGCFTSPRTCTRSPPSVYSASPFQHVGQNTPRWGEEEDQEQDQHRLYASRRGR